MRREASQSVDTNVTAMHAAKDALLAWLPGRLRAFTDQSVARLVAKAAHAHSNAEQTPYFDAITELKRRSTDLETEMADLVLSRLDNLGSAIRSSDPVPVPAAFELSLVDLDEFEISMSVAGMATKAENRNDQPLFEMSRRMTAIAGSVIDNTNNPLAPASVCDPFHSAMQDAPIAADALVIIYACFDDLVVAELGGLYERVNRALMEAGVELAPARAKSKIKRDKPSDLAEVDDDEGVLEADEVAVEEAVELEAEPEPEQPPIDDSVIFSDAQMLDVPTEAASTAIDETELLEVPASSGTVDEGPAWMPGNPAWPVDSMGSADPFSGDPFDAPGAGGGQQNVNGGPGAQTAPPSGGAEENASPAGSALGVGGGAAAPSHGSAAHEQVGGGGPTVGGAGGSAAGGGMAGGVGHRTGAGGYGGLGGSFAVPARPGTGFGAAHTMLTLNRTLANAGDGVAGFGGSGGGGAGGTGVVSSAGEDQNLPQFDVDQLVALLSQLQPGAVGGESGGSFRNRLRDVIQSASGGGGGVSGADGGSGLSAPVGLVAGPLGDAVELVMALFEAFREDREIGAELLSRLNPLEPAIHKLALLDPSFFDVAEHPARQMLNQLARLRPELGDTESPESAFWDVVDSLLSPVLSGFDRDISLFGDVLTELDSMIQRQATVYQANVDAVVAACGSQEAFILARRGLQEDGPAIGDPSERGVSKEWAVWLNRAARIEVGEQLESGSRAEIDHLSLAWISHDHSNFVFVGRRGEKSRTMSHQELAMQLRRGTAAIVRSQDQPLVDRALNRVLQDLHGLWERRATRDPATGLLNRQSLLARLRDALEQSGERGHGVALLGFAIAELPKVTETYGPEAGKVLLRRVARTMSSILGNPTSMACVGERLLMAFVPDITAADADELAGKVVSSVAKLRIRWGEEEPFSPTLRATAVVAPPGESPTDTLEKVEQGASEEKSPDRPAVEVQSLIRVEAGGDGHDAYEALIRKTLSQDGVHLRCHRIAPLIDERHNRSHFEVLLGIRDDSGEPVSAAEFVRAAEHLGHMPAVDRWVMRNMLNWMRDHRRWLRKVGGFAINLSGASLSDPHLVEYVLELLSQSRVPPGKILFEVTETVAVDNMSNAQNFLRTLCEVGCRFALDDFGSGQSSYGYLKRLPVDYVKIDGMFVRDVETDEADLAVVRSVNEIAHFMGKKTVAEFVQSQVAVERLREVGVDYGQGFYIEMPFYVEDATEAMLSSSPKVLELPTPSSDAADDQVAVSLGY